MKKELKDIIKKGTCKICGKEYGFIGLDILERCVDCLDKMETEDERR